METLPLRGVAGYWCSELSHSLTGGLTESDSSVPECRSVAGQHWLSTHACQNRHGNPVVVRGQRS